MTNGTSHLILLIYSEIVANLNLYLFHFHMINVSEDMHEFPSQVVASMIWKLDISNKWDP